MSNKTIIIIVEDNYADYTLTEIAFKEKKIHYDLKHCVSGYDLFQFLEKTDLGSILMILLDLNMPLMSGKEVLAKMQTFKKYNSLPVIVFSTSQNKEDILDSYNLGANAYVSKPVDIEESEKVLSSIVNFWGKINKT